MDRIFISLALSVVCVVQGKLFDAEFKSAEVITHQAIDLKSGTVYLGCTNKLYQLTGDLDFVFDNVTGPGKENKGNENKALLVFNEGDSLITCGTSHSGTCEIRSLSNISIATAYRNPTDAGVFYGSQTQAFAFLAPAGPFTDSGSESKQMAMYVGTSSSEGRPPPLISTRKLQMKPFEVYVKSSLQATEAVLESDKKGDFYVEYVSGFSHEGFSYFLTVQLVLPEKIRNESRIVRICQKDARYGSYIELPIKCSVGSRNYNYIQDTFVTESGSNLANSMNISTNESILYAVFTNNPTGRGANSDDNQSAVCIYSLRDIRQVLFNATKICFKDGIGKKVAHLMEFPSKGHFTGEKCTVYPTQITEDYCDKEGTVPLNYPLAGVGVIEARPVLEFSDFLTAIAVTDVNNFTIAFLGTSQGSIKKITISSPIHGRQYEDVPIHPGHRVSQDILFDKNKTHLYATAGNKVVKMRVTDCSRHLTCDTCLGSGDPYCGWCSLEKKCSRRGLCGHSDMPLRWLGKGTSQCIAVTNMTPKNTSLNQRATIGMNIANLPESTDQAVPYYCIFGDMDIAYPAKEALVSGLSCQTPPVHLIPPLVDKDYVAVRLKIRSNETGVDFLETDFYFYKCQTHSLCSKCVSTEWPCDWCIFDNLCTHNSSSCSSSSNVILSNKYPYVAKQGGKDYCPQLVASNSSEILLPNGQKKEIVVRGKNLPDPGDGLFECVVRQGDPQEIRQPARRTSNKTVVCQNQKPYSYTEDEEYLEVPLTIAWRRSSYQDSQYFDSDIKVTIYKCDKMGPDCSRCTSSYKTDAKYQCAWCTGTSTCTFNKTCKGPLNDNVKCANPMINSFEPKSGPIEGGTNLTIRGTDLGKTFDDVNGTGALIMVAGRKCIPYKEFYVIAKIIVCRIEPKPKHVMSDDGPISIRLKNGQTGKSKYGEIFTCRDPKIQKIFPSLGPKSGESKITISGEWLDTGVKDATRAYIGPYPCEINKSISQKSIICYTSPVNSSMTVTNVSVTFDGHTRVMAAIFNYTEDPTVTGIEPLTSIRSGGIPVAVMGTNFLSIQRPLMFVQRGNWRSEETECGVMSNIKMICPSPNVSEDFLPMKRTYRAERATPSKETHLDVGFKMDGVQSVQTVNESFPGVAHTITYTLDPEYFPFENGEKNFVPGESSRLIIEGRNLKLGNNAKDVQVMIGDEKCNITSLAPTELSCIPPVHQPAGVNVESSPIVKVSVGRNLHFKLGSLIYKIDNDDNFPPVAIYAIAGAAGLLLLIIIVILVICKRKSTKHEREFKHLQIQLDTWESNVREECKQGFAELQTDMTDLTSDLNASGIPFWSYQMYTFRVLFPSLKDHPILHRTEVRNSPRTTIEQAMTQFNQLVINKNFLLTLIRTLEEQKGFSIRDKANVASLLMIILQDKMEYATEIVKVLLNELIDKYMEKKQPKLLLRRTESVVEKLLANWLSICLYENLKESTGEPLFMLFKAIKHQVEKGPVDAVTADARYSLSEDRLLREKTQQNTVDLDIVLDDGEIIKCKVLLCDTITQVKEKMLDTIYKNTPFSHRPSVYDLDLEWRSGRSGQGHLCLQDDDMTTNPDASGWKKINTLEHYKVPDGAQMALVPKQHDSLGRTCNGGTGGLNGNLAISMSSITPILQDIESGAKIFHLVKQGDFDSSGKERSHKVITEIFLPRLLSTKGTLQTFVDDLFKTILTVDDQLPTAIKYLFDFLDEAADRHSISDQEVIYTWKSNSLPLRFWVNIIKNPNFTFDVHKPAIVDSCLSVIAQTFMDSCSTTEHRLGKDSPTNKLLYAKDIPNYKKMVNQYYHDIKALSPVSDQDMKIYLGELSKIHPTEINVTVALKELYEYVTKYKDEVRMSIEDNPLMKKEVQKLEQIISTMEMTESIA
ncbi:plexin-A2-like isoform X2 [Lineus longissimus]|uniref:plexin-A2-like isoform X2 n=1 Tax=Lineus longissimus TaxID=88925 RepID=UPI00315C54A7